MRSLPIPTALGLLAATAIGCATVGAPPVPSRHEAKFRYKSGWGAQQFDQPAEDARAASTAALRDLQVRSLHQERSGTAWLLDGRAHDGRPVRVAIQPTADGSHVAARVGRAGDPAFAETFLDRVEFHLESRAAGAAPPPTPSHPPSPSRFARNAVPDAIMFADQVGSTYRDSPFP